MKTTKTTKTRSKVKYVVKINGKTFDTARDAIAEVRRIVAAETPDATWREFFDRRIPDIGRQTTDKFSEIKVDYQARTPDGFLTGNYRIYTKTVETTRNEMSYIYAGTIFDTAHEAAQAAVEWYLTAGGNNDDDEVAEYLAECSDAEIINEMQGVGWEPPKGVTWGAMCVALGAVRESRTS